ncbi:MAG: carboxymuconolactone decarboxylase family protein [Gammaproteobacteria bacterium]
MSHFPLHDEHTAPTAARPWIEQAKQGFGFLPNLIAGMAEAPALAEGYLTLSDIYARTGLNAQERELVLLAVSRENGCDYCVAAHSMLAQMSQLPAEAIQAIRDGREIPDPRLEALRCFSTQLVEKRGWVNDEDIRAFLGAGYEISHVGDVILAVGLKTLSNYFNHIAGTPLDQAIQGHAWKGEGDTGP